MKPDKAALHNLNNTQKERQQRMETVTRDLRIALVVKPDGDWVAVGGNEPESERMAKAIWGTPDGSITLWADVQVSLPKKYVLKPEPAVEPLAGEILDRHPFDVAQQPIPSGMFAGPGTPIDVEIIPTLGEAA